QLGDLRIAFAVDLDDPVSVSFGDENAFFLAGSEELPAAHLIAEAEHRCFAELALRLVLLLIKGALRLAVDQARHVEVWVAPALEYLEEFLGRGYPCNAARFDRAVIRQDQLFAWGGSDAGPKATADDVQRPEYKVRLSFLPRGAGLGCSLFI